VCVEARDRQTASGIPGRASRVWDYDFPTNPILGELTVDWPAHQGGHPGEQAGFHVRPFDEDRPADLAHRGTPGASSTVAGEWTSPTQPFPTKPPPFELQGTTDDI